MYLGGQAERGYAMAALLVSIAVLSVMLGVAMPVWRQYVQREKEAELVFRGEQYARAIALFQRKSAGTFPPSIDLLIEQKFLRKRYRDPMTEDGKFQVLYQASASQQPQGGATGRAGQPGGQAAVIPQPPSSNPTTGTGPRGGVVGVVSMSEEASIRLYNGRGHYNEWQFVHTAATAQPGGGAARGQPGRGASPGAGVPTAPETRTPQGRRPGGPGVSGL